MLSNKPMLFAALGVLAVGGALAYAVTHDDVPQQPVAITSPVEEECVPSETRDERRIAGTAIGALVGGAVGRDVGDRDVTTAAGAAAGAIAGNQAQKQFQENRSDC